METFVAAVVISLAVAWLCAKSYEKGVNDTEKRWSDAVAKGEWERRYGGR